MSNATFPIKLGSRNGGNGVVANKVANGGLPGPWAPQCTWSRRYTYTELRLLGPTVTGTIDVADPTGLDGGIWEVTFELDNADDVTVTYEQQPADNADDVATGLAAAITAVIATTLDGIVVSADAVTSQVVLVYEPGIAVAVTVVAPVVTEVTVGGTAATGNYRVTFDLPVDVPATYAATVPTDTNTVIATELAAAIDALIATTLAGIVLSVSSAVDVVSIMWVNGEQVPLVLTVHPVGATLADSDVEGSAPYTDVSALTLTFDDFPADVVRGQFVFRVKTGVAGTGMTTCSIIVGDANDDNGLLTTTSAMTPGAFQTVAAAESATRYEPAFVPQVTFSSDGLFDQITAGDIRFELDFTATVPAR